MSISTNVNLNLSYSRNISIFIQIYFPRFIGDKMSRATLQVYQPHSTASEGREEAKNIFLGNVMAITPKAILSKFISQASLVTK